MRRVAYPFLFLIFICSNSFSQTAQEYFEKGNFMFELGKLDKAIELYSKAVQIKSDYIDAYYGRAKTYFAQTDFNDALADYDKILELKPDYIDVLNDRGKLYTFMKRYDEGFLDFNKALEIDPKNANTYYLRGSAYFFFLNDKNKAKDDLQNAIEYNPKLKQAYNLMANIYVGNTLNLVLQKIKEGSKESDPQNFLTDTLKSELNEALKYATFAISIDSTYSSPYVTRGGVYFSLGQYDKSVKEYEKALQLNLVPVEEKIARMTLEVAKSMIKN